MSFSPLSSPAQGVDPKRLLSPTPGKGSTQAKWKAALDFESMFLGQLMKSMRQTVAQEEGAEASPERQTYTEMLDQQYASLNAHAKSSLDPNAPARAQSGASHSLAAQIYRSMLRHDETAGNASSHPWPAHADLPPSSGWIGGQFLAKPAAPADRPSQKLSEAELNSLAVEAGKKHGLPASLIRSVIQTESAGDTLAVSKAGAKGLMQLMDGTAADLGVANSFDPSANVDAGAKYLKGLLHRFDGDLSKALAGYNAGPSAVDKHAGIPPFPETRNYVNSVLGRMRKYQARLGE